MGSRLLGHTEYDQNNVEYLNLTMRPWSLGLAMRDISNDFNIYILKFKLSDDFNIQMFKCCSIWNYDLWEIRICFYIPLCLSVCTRSTVSYSKLLWKLGQDFLDIQY